MRCPRPGCVNGWIYAKDVTYCCVVCYGTGYTYLMPYQLEETLRRLAAGKAGRG